MATIWVLPLRTDRRVIAVEADEAHPGDECWIVGYPDRTDDAGQALPGNQPIEVGDTALIRQRIAEGALREVPAPAPAKASKKGKAAAEPAEPAADATETASEV